MALLGGEDGGERGIRLRAGSYWQQTDFFFVLNLCALQLTRGIFTKVIQEIARVENSYGQERRCRLM